MYNWSTGLCETVRNSPVDDVCWRFLICRGVAILLMRIGSTAAMKILKGISKMKDRPWPNGASPGSSNRHKMLSSFKNIKIPASRLVSIQLFTLSFWSFFIIVHLPEKLPVSSPKQTTTNMWSFLLRVFVFLLECWQLSGEYSELMRSELGVFVEPLRIVYENATHPPLYNIRCRLSLHKSDWDRDSCSNPQLRLNDTVSWSTRVCYKWVCDTTQYAMRVESCWIGTKKNPVFLIRNDGCTIERAILTSPVYSSFTRAAAIGWLSVREKGMRYVSVGCTIRLCHLCDPDCQDLTPPTTCRDGREADYVQMWNTSSRVKNLCFPEPPTTSPPPLSDAASFVCTSLLSLFCLIIFLL
ncbi:unnamed protein product [Caenorhabditis auriculariae]|uniref:ZP domain-containing protein n=1 Tax=Caenorhabditis auriculariae TaxID=2777116 RepID=A0A8S1HT51_9PELO|nr:unnamed protein product [Caenorhabditis auriculariae]